MSATQIQILMPALADRLMLWMNKHPECQFGTGSGFGLDRHGILGDGAGDGWCIDFGCGIGWRSTNGNGLGCGSDHWGQYQIAYDPNN